MTLVGMILVDVAVRRIAWDWKHMKQMAFAGVAYIRSYTTAPQAQPARTLENLKKVHEGVATTTTAKAIPNILTSGFAAPAAATTSASSPKREPERETRRAFHTGGLLEAKRRAQQQITDMKNDPKQ